METPAPGVPTVDGREPGVHAIVVAAGEGRRLGGPTPKQFLLLLGQPLLVHTLRRLLSCRIDGAVVVLPGESIDTFEQTVRPHVSPRPPIVVARGGQTRAASVRAGLEALSPGAAIVLVHDGVRPFVDEGLVARVVEGARRVGACIPAVAVTETLKEVAQDGRVVRTVDRLALVAAQTPQGFEVERLREAYDSLGPEAETATDCAQLIERMGWPVAVVEGSAANIKVTLPFDVAVARLILEEMA